MKQQKLFTAILAVSMVFSSMGSLTANAADVPAQTTSMTEDERATPKCFHNF